MYNPEAVYWTEENSFVNTEAVADDFAGEIESSFISEDDFLFPGHDDEIVEDVISDSIFESSEFEKLVEQINSDVTGMRPWEIEDYMQNRMGEFWPALLAAAAPAIIQMAPQVIGAVSSLFSKGSAPRPAPPPPPAPPARPAPPPAAIAPVKPVPVRIAPRPAPAANNNNNNNNAQLINALTSLIQSPAIQQLINNLASGSLQSINTSGGQQINASGVLGVLSSLAGSLAGSLSGNGRIPEYAVGESGHFLIDPLDPVQEAELILDLINS
jgi:hypothetical protein